jgi:[ribosomal protein S18]-alanine N-acetyltransferase
VFRGSGHGQLFFLNAEHRTPEHFFVILVSSPVNCESIRTFRAEDIPHIMEIERQAFPKGRYPKELILEYGRKYPDSFIVLELENDLAGYMIYDRGGHIFSMAVKPSFRRRGLGGRMFSYARKLAHGNLWLEVRSKNTGAIRFYESMGMRIRGKVPRYYETDDALVMVDEGKLEQFKAES